MKEYEALFVIDPARENDLKKVTDNIAQSITKAKGNVTKEENWGKQKIAYAIKKTPEGIFYKLNFSVDPREISTIKSDYKLNADILRVMITTK